MYVTLADVQAARILASVYILVVNFNYLNLTFETKHLAFTCLEVTCLDTGQQRKTGGQAFQYTKFIRGHAHMLENDIWLDYRMLGPI